MIRHFKVLSNQLSEIYPLREAESIAMLLLEHFGQIRKNDIFLIKSDKNPVPDEVISRLMNHEPVQYILDYTYFSGLKLKVNSSVLIPRPETEELVGLICKFETKTRGTILDIGTGSGCIALALKTRLPGWQIQGIDISEKAIEIARQNAAYHHLETSFSVHNIFSSSIPDFMSANYDVIVSNPPYVTESEKLLMHSNVLDFEPSSALFVSDDHPFVYYRKIIEMSQNILHYNGRIYFEINENFGAEIKRLSEEYGFVNTEIHQDLSGKDRFAICCRASFQDSRP